MEHFEKCVKDGDNFGNLQFFCFVFFFNSLKLNVLECAAFPRRFGKLAPSRDRVVECALETRTQRRLGPAPSLWNWSQVFPSSVSRPRQQGNSSEAGPWRGGGGGRYILGFNFSRRHRQEYWHSASSGVPGRPRAYAFWKSPGITPVRPPHRRARLPRQVPRGLKQGDGPQGTRRVKAPASTHSPSCAALLENSVVSIFWTRGLWVEASGRSSHTTIKAVAWHHLPDTTVPATRLPGLSPPHLRAPHSAV